MECLNTEVLCLHLQNELDSETQQHVEAHLRACQSCADRLKTMQEDDAMLRSVLVRAPARQVRSQGCCSAEELSAYANGLLTPQETARCERHLDTCDFCLGEVMAMRHMQRLLKHAAPLTPPASVVAAARRGFAKAAQPSVLEQLGSLIIQVATDGLKFVEALLLPEDVRLAINGRAALEADAHGAENAPRLTRHRVAQAAQTGVRERRGDGDARARRDGPSVDGQGDALRHAPPPRTPAWANRAPDRWGSAARGSHPR